MDSDNKQDPAASQVADLVILLSRLIHQVNRFDPGNETVAKAMDYLRRKDLLPSIIRGVNEHTMAKLLIDQDKPAPTVPIWPLLLKFITDEKKKNKIIGHYTAVGSINPEFVKSASLGDLNSTCLKLVGDGRFFKILYPPGWVGDRPMELTDIYWV